LGDTWTRTEESSYRRSGNLQMLVFPTWYNYSQFDGVHAC
jgi:hypothetical protein